MLIVETIAKIRREHREGKPIKEIARDLRLSRNTVRNHVAALYSKLERPRRDRLRLTRIHDLLEREGFTGSYDAVRRYAARWKRERRTDGGDMSKVFIPLMFRPGEAYQFDWSHEDVEIAGKPMRVKVAHMRLCWSRAPYVRAYPRETQEMLFDAHARGFAFFGGVPTRGIYDNMKTAVTRCSPARSGCSTGAS